MSKVAEAKKERTADSDAAASASPDPARPEENKSPEERSPALVAADLSSVPAKTSGSGLLLTGLAMSLLLHVGLVVYLQSGSVDDIGPGGIQLEAISVDLVPVTNLHAGVPERAVAPGYDTEDQDKKDKTEAARREVTDSPPEGLIKPTDGAAELAAAEIIKPDPVHEHRDKEVEKEKLEKPEEPDTAQDDRGRAKQAQEAADLKVKGGSSVTATPGQISRYALSIQQTLNANRPHHVGTRGRAVVKFGLTDTGSVRFAEISKSSGSKLVDDAVVAAIWRMRFPVPPEGMSEKDRSYTAPIEFR